MKTEYLPMYRVDQSHWRQHSALIIVIAFNALAAVAAILLPRLSGSVEQGDRRASAALVKNGLYTCWVACVPVSIVFFVLREPIVRVLLERGAFQSHSVVQTAGFLGGYALAIFAQSLVLLLFRAVVATEKLRVAVLWCVCAAAVNVAFDFALTPLMGAVTLGTGAAIGNSLTAVGLWLVLRRHLDLRWTVRVSRTGIRLALCNVPVLILAVLVRKVDSLPGMTSQGLATSIAILGGVLVIACCYLACLVGFHLIRAEGRGGA